MSERILHCWMGRSEYVAETHGDMSDEYIANMSEPSATCMLEDGHQGDHEWTLDSDITLVFAPTSVTP